MKNPSGVRGLAYLSAAAVMLLCAVLFQRGLNDVSRLVPTYYRSNLYLFIVLAVLGGGGIYLWREHARRHRALLGDVAFLLIGAAVLLVAFIVLFARYGGLGDAVSRSAVIAADCNSVLLFLLPFAFWLRAGAALLRAERDRWKTVGVTGALLLAAVMLILILSGQLLHIQQPDAVLLQMQ
ncbi:MAG: hypothetical protein IKI50_05910 [Clostridia bacterium]|nr:hypothetical protein [Clostridia bacterium]